MQLGVIKNLSQFFRNVSEATRSAYLALVHDILHAANPFNWRFRQCIAAQLPELIQLPAVENLYETLFPLVMTLLQDPVAHVRKDSFRGIAELIRLYAAHVKQHALSDDSPVFLHMTTIVSAVNSFIKGQTYQSRQLWVDLCHHFLHQLSQEELETHFIAGIVKLASDRVCNVRISVAGLLVGWDREPMSKGSQLVPRKVSTEEDPLADVRASATTSAADADAPTGNWIWLLKKPEIVACIEKLADDSLDVYFELKRLEPLFPSIEFKRNARQVRKHDEEAIAAGAASDAAQQSNPTAPQSAEPDEIPAGDDSAASDSADGFSHKDSLVLLGAAPYGSGSHSGLRGLSGLSRPGLQGLDVELAPDATGTGPLLDIDGLPFTDEDQREPALSDSFDDDEDDDDDDDDEEEGEGEEEGGDARDGGEASEASSGRRVEREVHLPLQGGGVPRDKLPSPLPHHNPFLAMHSVPSQHNSDTPRDAPDNAKDDDDVTASAPSSSDHPIDHESDLSES